MSAKKYSFWNVPDKRTLAALDQLKHSEELAPLVNFLEQVEEYLKDALVSAHEDAFQRLQGAAVFAKELNHLISNARGYLTPPSNKRGVNG